MITSEMRVQAHPKTGTDRAVPVTSKPRRTSTTSAYDKSMRTKLPTLAIATLLTLTACGDGAKGDSTASQSPEHVVTEQTTSPTIEAPAPSRSQVDNTAACLKFEFGEDPLADRIPEAVSASRADTPGATSLMLDVHTDIQLLIMETDGPLAETLTKLGEPFQVFNDAYYAGETQVDMNVGAVPYDLADVLEICSRL